MKQESPTFRELHNRSKILILPNVWDVGSARIFEDAGAQAIATTSAGVGWSQGYPDGDKLPVRLLAELAKNILRVIKVPLSVDVEGGYTAEERKVGEHIKPILDTGVAGINIEDGEGSPDSLIAKIADIRRVASKMGIDLFINARTDVYLREMGTKESRASATITRAKHYQDAGADGVFVPALSDPEEIKEIVSGLQMPVNVMVWPGLPDAAELEKLGVKRLSAGSGIPQVIWKHAADLASDFLKTGSSKPMSENYMAHGKLQGLFAQS